MPILTVPPPPESPTLHLVNAAGLVVELDAGYPDGIAYYRARGFMDIRPVTPGYLYWLDRSDRLHCLPELPVGESYREAGGYGSAILIPDWCWPASYMNYRPFGPLQFDCWRSECLLSGGCAECNPEQWRYCSGGGCTNEEHYRVPADLDESECPCARDCDECAQTTLPGEMRRTVDGLVCFECCDSYFTECEYCGDRVRDQNFNEHMAESHDYGDDDDDDSDEDNGSGGVIHNYSYKPRPNFQGEDRYYLGLEAEVYTGAAHRDRMSIAEDVDSNLGDWGYLKSDCSIPHGFEIVTHPMSYRHALDNFPWKMWEEMRADGVKATSDCGIHVHVSRTAFDGPSHAYRFLKLYYRNADTLGQVARRSNASYARFSGSNKEWAVHAAVMYNRTARDSGAAYDWHGNPAAWYLKTPEGRQRLNRIGAPHYTERYSAVNVENDATMEVRIFAGSVYQSQVKAALGLVHATVEYTRTLNAHAVIRNGALEFDSLRAWVKDNNADGMYTDLLNEIERLVH